MVLPALPAAGFETPIRVPRGDLETVVNTGPHNLGDLDPEAVRLAVAVFLDGAAGDLRLAIPVGRLVLRWVDGRRMQRDSWIPLEVKRFDCPCHRPDSQLAILELDLRAADPRRSITSQGGHGAVFSDTETVANCRYELRLGLFDLAPTRRATNVISFHRTVHG